MRDPEQGGIFSDSRVVKIKLDITNHDQILKASEIARDTQVLINNAGVAAYISAFEGPVDLIERDMKTNYFETLDMMRVFMPVLEKNTSPAMINIVSVAAFVNFPILGGYCASKAALFSLTQAARIEYKKKGISCS